MNRRVDELEVELLRPNEAAFGNAGAGGFVDMADDLPVGAFDDEPRPRWTMAIAGLLVSGLLAGGIIAAAPWSDDTSATPPSTAPPATPTTGPSTDTTVSTPRPTVPRDPLAGVLTRPTGWVAEPPGDGWEFGGNYSNGEAIVAGGTGDRIDVWAARDTDRTTGPWVIVHSTPYGQGQLHEGATRTMLGDRPAIVQARDDGTTRLIVSLGPDSATVVIDGLGIGLDQLVQLGSTVQPPEQMERTPIRYGDLRTRDGLFGLPLRYTGQPDYSGIGLLGQASAMTNYWQDVNGGAAVEIAQRPLNAVPIDELSMVFVPVDVASQLRPLITHLARIGRDVEVYSVADQPDTTIALWQEGDQLISVTGYGTAIEEVLLFAASARPATGDEWHDLLVKSQRGISFESDDEEPTMFQAGPFDTDGEWQATLSPTWFWINSVDSGWYGSFAAVTEATVFRFVGTDVTVWLAIDPTGAATTMRVTVPGGEPVVVDTETLGPARAAFHLRRSDAPAIVELIDAAGAVVFSADA